jgi:hypothetical protein
MMSAASSSQVSGMGRTFETPTTGSASVRVRSRYLERLLDQPFLQARAARMASHLAAQAAQVLILNFLLFCNSHFTLLLTKIKD